MSFILPIFSFHSLTCFFFFLLVELPVAFLVEQVWWEYILSPSVLACKSFSLLHFYCFLISSLFKRIALLDTVFSVDSFCLFSIRTMKISQHCLLACKVSAEQVCCQANGGTLTNSFPPAFCSL